MKHVAVLRGGPSEEYEISLQTGSGVLNALQDLQYPHKDIIITKRGEWLENGFVRQPEQVLETMDVVFVALHGTYGEDGQVQRILQRKRVPFTGSNALSSAIAFNKILTKQTLLPHGIKMPRHRQLTSAEYTYLKNDPSELFADLGPELFVKPVATGSSFGAHYVAHEAALRHALAVLFEVYDRVLVEEYIRGREATVGVLDNFRNEQAYVLPVVEIVPPQGEPLFSHAHKYDGEATEIVPGRFSYHEKAVLSDTARQVHEIIGCSNYSRSDFIVRDGEVYFLEVNSLPGLTKESLFPKAAAAVGLEFPYLIQHLVETATV